MFRRSKAKETCFRAYLSKKNLSKKKVLGFIYFGELRIIALYLFMAVTNIKTLTVITFVSMSNNLFNTFSNKVGYLS